MAKHQKSPLLALFAVILAGLWIGLVYAFSQSYGNELSTRANAFVGSFFGISGERLMAILGPYVVPMGAASICIWAAFMASLVYLRHTEYAEDPKASPQTLTPMSVSDIADHILNYSAWGWRKRRQLTFKKFVQWHVAREMTRAGRDFDVRYMGAPPNSEAFVEIGRIYWRHARIDPISLWHPLNKAFTTVIETGVPIVGGSSNYSHGSAPRVDVMHTWPRASAFMRWRISIRLWIRIRLYGVKEEPNYGRRVRREDAAEEELIRLNAEINQSPMDIARYALLQLRAGGITLRNKSISTDSEFNGWKSDYHTWRVNVLLNAETLSHVLHNWLENLDQLQPLPDGINTYNDEHAKYATIMSEILRRLQQYQERGLLSGNG